MFSCRLIFLVPCQSRLQECLQKQAELLHKQEVAKRQKEEEREENKRAKEAWDRQRRGLELEIAWLKEELTQSQKTIEEIQRKQKVTDEARVGVFSILGSYCHQVSALILLPHVVQGKLLSCYVKIGYYYWFLYNLICLLCQEEQALGESLSQEKTALMNSKEASEMQIRELEVDVRTLTQRAVERETELERFVCFSLQFLKVMNSCDCP